MRLVGISGSIVGSKTQTAVKEILTYSKQLDPNLDVDFINLKDYDLDFCDGRDINEYSTDTKRLIKQICQGDYFIIGTPVFQGSFTGALKNVFDLLPVDALRHKVVGFVATGGTFQHYLVIENQLKPIAGFFRCYVAPSHVYVNDSHFENGKIVDQDVLKRMEALAEELIFMQTKLKAN